MVSSSVWLVKTVAGWEFEVLPDTCTGSTGKNPVRMCTASSPTSAPLSISLSPCLSFKPADCFGSLISVVRSTTTGFTDEVDTE